MTGRAEDALADIDGLRPYVRRRRRRRLGEREGDPGERAALAETDISVLDLDALRAGAMAVPPRRPTGCTSTPTCSTARSAAVDSPAPDGLTFDELAALLRGCSPAARSGMQVTVFDPDLDPDGIQARALTDCLVSALL